MLSKFSRILVATLFVGAITAFFGLGIDQYFSIKSLHANHDNLLDFVSEFWVLAMASYILIYILVTALCIPLGAFLTLTGGFLFGPIYGALFSIIAANLGAFILFTLAKNALGEFLWKMVVNKLKEHKFERVVRGLQQNALYYILCLRLAPIIPFYIANLLPAFTGVKPGIFVLGTFIGIIPGTIVYSFLGSSLGDLMENKEKFSFDSFFSSTSFYALIVLTIFAFSPIVYRIFIRRKNN